MPHLLRSRGFNDNERRFSVSGKPFRRSSTVPNSGRQFSFSSLRKLSYDLSMGGDSSAPNEKHENVARSLLTRGSRILRRQNTKPVESDAWDGFKKDFTLGDSSAPASSAASQYGFNHNRSRSAQSGKSVGSDKSIRHVERRAESSMRRKISEPFNFVHLTHTHRDHFNRLEDVPQNELVTEFSAIRAGQAPGNELKGINAADIHYDDSESQDDILPIQDTSDLVCSTTSSPKSPRDVSGRSFHSPPCSPKSSRQPQYIENFSHPNRRQLKSIPTVPPPRSSSRIGHAAPKFAEGYDDLDSPVIPDRSMSSSIDGRISGGHMHERSLGTPPIQEEEEDETEGYFSIAHAMTTPDNSAFTVDPSPYLSQGTDLTDVPEEEETVSWQRNPSTMSTRRASSAVRPSLRHSVSLPSAAISGVRPDVQQQRSQAFVLGPSFEDEQVIPKDDISSRRMSVRLKSVEGNWEDVIDYSYDHAAEADCDFDWDRRSSEGVGALQDAAGDAKPLGRAINNQGAAEYQYFNNSVPNKYKHAQTSFMPIPESEPIPDDSYLAEPTRDLKGSRSCEGFMISPSLLIPPDFANQMADDAMYEDYLEDRESHQYQLMNASLEEKYMHQQNSTTSVHRYESQTPASSLKDHHRSVSSGASVPDLIRSKCSSGQFSEKPSQRNSALSTADTVVTLDTPPLSPRSISPLTQLERRSTLKEVMYESVIETNSSTTSLNDIEGEEISLPHHIPPAIHPATFARLDERRPSLPCSPAMSHPFGRRLRSTSSVGSGKTHAAARTSYTLFPRPSSPNKI